MDNTFLLFWCHLFLWFDSVLLHLNPLWVLIFWNLCMVLEPLCLFVHCTFHSHFNFGWKYFYLCNYYLVDEKKFSISTNERSEWYQLTNGRPRKCHLVYLRNIVYLGVVDMVLTSAPGHWSADWPGSVSVVTGRVSDGIFETVFERNDLVVQDQMVPFCQLIPKCSI